MLGMIKDIIGDLFLNTYEFDKGDRKIKLNLFALFQVLWVIELYYLAVDFIYKLITKEKLVSIISNDIISNFDSFNVFIISTMDKLCLPILLLSITILFSTLFVAVLIIAFFSKYMFIKITMNLIADIASWMFLIAATYIMYRLLWTITVIIFIIALYQLFKQLRNERAFG